MPGEGPRIRGMAGRRSLALVVQRYGAGIIGGAEHHARLLAERLAAEWRVEVFTTCATDYQSWKNTLPAGTEVQGDVRVNRFRTWIPRTPLFGLYSRLTTPLILWLARRSGLLAAAGRLLERLWFVLQGPFCPGLLSALTRRRGEFDRIVFMTYLYYPTVWGLRRLPAKSILIPTAHDEGPFYFQLVGEALRSARAVMANSVPEENLIRRRAGAEWKAPRLQIVGVGFDPPSAGVRGVAEIHNPKYVIYLGRIGSAKRVDLLVDWMRLARNRPGLADLRLKLAGVADAGFQVPSDDRIESIGAVDESAKWRLIRGAVAVVTLSPYESLSLVVLEALASGVPVIGATECEMLAYYSSIHPTVRTCSDHRGFADCLESVLREPPDGAKVAAAAASARSWVLTNYSWDTVLTKFNVAADAADLQV